MDRALLGGGCFWCTEGAYKRMKGIVSALPAYAGGPDKNPNYKSVCSGKTGHAEIVEIMYDPSIIDYSTILDIFFTVHDPTQLNRQGNDIGTQYRSCIMPLDENQATVARSKIVEMQEYFDRDIVTTIEEPINFVIAEKYHHDYYDRNPSQGYCIAVVGPKISKIRQKFAHLY